jgi:hypothetical protein
MWTDILIVAGIGFTQLVITWYGVHVSVAEGRLRNAFIIGVVGAAGIGLTVWGAIRAGLTQEHLQAQLDQIQRNTQQPPSVTVNPPVVNVNTPPTPVPATAALLSFDNFESSYSRTVNVNGTPVATRNSMFEIGKPVSENYYFTNTGSAFADRVTAIAHVYITTNETEKELTAKFRKYAKLHSPPPVGTIANGGKEQFWFTGLSDDAVTQDDYDKLSSGAERLYWFLSISYSDPSGSHYQHYCELLQPFPKDVPQPVIWHYCDDFTDHR